VTCPCDTPNHIVRLGIDTNPVVIDYPALPTESGVAEIPVGPGCTITTYGHAETQYFLGLTLIGVWARVGGGLQVPGTIAGNSWTVTGVPGAKWNRYGYHQIVTVKCDFQDLTGMPVSYSLAREFMSSSGPADCETYYYGDTTCETPAAMTEVIPRYFRVTAEFADPFGPGQPDSSQPGTAPFVGGLTANSCLYLAYDHVTSTPERPVWRDIGLPSSIGNWLLRVVRSQGRLVASLSLQTSTETCIFPANEFRNNYWSFKTQNLFHGSILVGTAIQDITLIVEPA